MFDLGTVAECHPEHIRFAQCKLREGSRLLENIKNIKILPLRIAQGQNDEIQFLDGLLSNTQYCLKSSSLPKPFLKPNIRGRNIRTTNNLQLIVYNIGVKFALVWIRRSHFLSAQKRLVQNYPPYFYPKANQ